MPISEDTPVEERELEGHRTELWAEDGHGLQEFLKLGITAHQDFVMSDGLRDFHGENEARRRPRFPIGYRSSGRAGVERGVHLDRRKVFRVEGQVVGRSQSLWIERPLPACGGE